MEKYKKDISNYLALAALIGAGFIAQPTIASGVYLAFIILPLVFVLKVFAHFEGYRQARDEYAPRQPIKGHAVYRIVEWMETPHFGVRGIWFALGLIVILMVYSRFH